MIYVPGDRGKKEEKHPLQRHNHVLVRGGRVKDLPGMKYTAICGKFDLPRLEGRRNARSKFSIQLNRGVKRPHRSDRRYTKFLYH